jgi:hypothetical protein
MSIMGFIKNQKDKFQRMKTERAITRDANIEREVRQREIQNKANERIIANNKTLEKYKQNEAKANPSKLKAIAMGLQKAMNKKGKKGKKIKPNKKSYRGGSFGGTSGIQFGGSGFNQSENKPLNYGGSGNSPFK